MVDDIVEYLATDPVRVGLIPDRRLHGLLNNRIAQGEFIVIYKIYFADFIRHITQSANLGRPIKPAGLGARDSLRTEAGMPLYGHELSEEWDSISAGQSWCVHLDKNFIGREALRKIKEQGPSKLLVGLEVNSKRTPRQDAPIISDGETVGVVTSGLSSPTLGKVIAMGFVPPALSEIGTAVEIALGKAKLLAKVVPLPFYKKQKN